MQQKLTLKMQELITLICKLIVEIRIINQQVHETLLIQNGGCTAEVCNLTTKQNQYGTENKMLLTCKRQRPPKKWTSLIIALICSSFHKNLILKCIDLLSAKSLWILIQFYLVRSPNTPNTCSHYGHP